MSACESPIIAGNWKMHKTVAEAVAPGQAAEGAGRAMRARAWRSCVCPPFTALCAAVGEVLEGHRRSSSGAQNVHWEDEGAFTGEVSPAMLKDLRLPVRHRRPLGAAGSYFDETDETVARKVEAALGAGLAPSSASARRWTSARRGADGGGGRAARCEAVARRPDARRSGARS